jgi:mono/diheme cytochrome c family protein
MRTHTLAFGIAVVCAPQIQAADDSDTQKLYEQHCVGCHGTEVYTREDRKVTSLAGLKRQVKRCETALGLRWFDEEISDMTEHLNERFYHFVP